MKFNFYFSICILFICRFFACYGMMRLEAFEEERQKILRLPTLLSLEEKHQKIQQLARYQEQLFQKQCDDFADCLLTHINYQDNLCLTSALAVYKTMALQPLHLESQEKCLNSVIGGVKKIPKDTQHYADFLSFYHDYIKFKDVYDFPHPRKNDFLNRLKDEDCFVNFLAMCLVKNTLRSHQEFYLQQANEAYFNVVKMIYKRSKKKLNDEKKHFDIETLGLKTKTVKRFYMENINRLTLEKSKTDPKFFDQKFLNQLLAERNYILYQLEPGLQKVKNIHGHLKHIQGKILAFFDLNTIPRIEDMQFFPSGLKVCPKVK